jgi:hypothetical protein
MDYAAECVILVDSSNIFIEALPPEERGSRCHHGQAARRHFMAHRLREATGDLADVT